MEEEHVGFLADPHSWVLFSAIVFAVVAWKKGKAPLVSMLDARTAKIRAELEEAQRLRAEAEKLLADYQEKTRHAEEAARKIIAEAKQSAAALQATAEKKLTEDLARRENQLMERIARAEQTAVQEVRRQAADLAANAAREMITQSLSTNGNKLVDDAVRELGQKLG